MQDWLHDTRQLDLAHPRLRITAHKLTQSLQTLPARAAAIQDFVRRMPFAAAVHPANTRASRVLERRHGDGAAKAVLFTALCRAAGLPARVQFLRVRAHCLAGILNDVPETMTHAVAQVHVDGRWISTDGYVLDPLLFARARQLLQQSQLDSGWGLVRDASSFWDGKSPCLQQFRWDDVVLSYGVFDDVQEFVQSGLHKERRWLGGARQALRTCVLNWRVARLRNARQAVLA
ncbi:MAG TPA: transglutaminase family protein [Ramlibacter sp.]|jgi:transglutaminase-like putative cysteine protease|nr:transglutaminase family protein [Ramlibacter sp.]